MQLSWFGISQFVTTRFFKTLDPEVSRKKIGNVMLCSIFIDVSTSYFFYLKSTVEMDWLNFTVSNLLSWKRQPLLHSAVAVRWTTCRSCWTKVGGSWVAGLCQDSRLKFTIIERLCRDVVFFFADPMLGNNSSCIFDLICFAGRMGQATIAYVGLLFLHFKHHIV